MTYLHLARPFALPAGVSHLSDLVTQAFGPTTFAGEPAGFWYPDSSGNYFSADAGATRIDHFHCGIDLSWANCAGTPLLASAPGTVVFAGWDTTGFGNCVKIDHGPVITLYGHLSEIDVQVGQKLITGQAFGKIGTTGNSTGPHTHLSTLDKSIYHYRDPWLYLTATAPSPVPKPAPKPAPVDPVHLVTFSVTADSDRASGGFAGPSERLPKVTDVLPGTVLQCVAWMYGEQKLDKSTGKPDARWFLVKDSNLWIASARVTGSPAGTNPLP